MLGVTPGRARRWPIRLAAMLPVVGRPVGLLLSEAWLRFERRRGIPRAPAAAQGPGEGPGGDDPGGSD
jgi:hypothetical protein